MPKNTQINRVRFSKSSLNLLCGIVIGMGGLWVTEIEGAQARPWPEVEREPSHPIELVVTNCVEACFLCLSVCCEKLIREIVEERRLRKKIADCVQVFYVSVINAAISCSGNRGSVFLYDAFGLRV